MSSVSLFGQMEDLGTVKVDTPDDVAAAVRRARAAQAQWRGSSFAQRRLLLCTIQRFIVENTATVARVACRDSGKTQVDAVFGEIAVTCEKLRWTIAHGEKWLLPEYRDSGLMNLHKTSRVEWKPVGVVGAIVPWNYPCHNVFNPIIAATFAGNAIVIKASEYAAWSTGYYQRVLDACLEAAGAPAGLIQIVNGFAETGNALVSCGADKIIFVGSVSVGRQVMKACADATRVTPLVLELGGKDPFIICDDVSIGASLHQLACRGVFQNMGQNCAGPERFLVYDAVYEQFCDGVVGIVQRMRQGAPLHSPFIDCGALCMPQHYLHLQRLVDDAVSKGATVRAGGQPPARGDPLAAAQFYPPTILCDVTEDMLIMKEEIFGPIMCISRLPNGDAGDSEAVRIANDCDFALSSCAHSGSTQRAARICERLEAGMSAVNDLEGTTYLSQSLPFGGMKSSGFDRFAGVEGLRGLCHVKAIVTDRFFSLSIPGEIAYPSTGQGIDFGNSIIQIVYGYSLWQRLCGVVSIVKVSLSRPQQS